MLALQVFNLAQVDGLEAPPEPERRTVDPLEVGEAVVAGMPNPPKIVYGGDSVACYRPAVDAVALPMRDDFRSADAYYHTAFHELAHSTGHESRLDRPEIAKATHAFGSADYSREELVAELGRRCSAAPPGLTLTSRSRPATSTDGGRSSPGQEIDRLCGRESATGSRLHPRA